MAFVHPNFRFVGWSFISEPNVLYDDDLVKRDIMNEFETGYRTLDYDPTFGSVIDDLVFDLQTPENQLMIENEIRRILSKDIRIEILSLKIFRLPHMYSADVQIKFGNIKEVSFKLEFDRRNSSGE